MNVMNKAKTCIECGRLVKEKHRKLCWPCINCHRRYGVDKEAWDKKQSKQACVVCERHTWGAIRNKEGKSICQHCFRALELLRKPECKNKLMYLLGLSG
jgi:hypothetical protein